MNSVFEAADDSSTIKKIVESHKGSLNFSYHPARSVTMLLITCNTCNLIEGTREEKLQHMIDCGIVKGTAKSLSSGVTKFMEEHCLDEFKFDKSRFMNKLGDVQGYRIAESRCTKRKPNEERIRRKAENDHYKISTLLTDMIQTANQLKVSSRN